MCNGYKTVTSTFVNLIFVHTLCAEYGLYFTAHVTNDMFYNRLMYIHCVWTVLYSSFNKMMQALDSYIIFQWCEHLCVM